MILNVTYAGLSNDVGPVPVDVSDDDIKRIAAEILSTTEPWENMCIVPNAFEDFVVDRFEMKYYLRPKVPFGL